MRAVPTLALVAALAALPATAHAGRRPFIWTYDVEVMPERGVELEQWVWERYGGATDLTSVWFSPIVGITDHVELALPIEWFFWEEPDSTQLETWGADLRIRLDSVDPVEAGAVVPLVRLGAKRLVRHPEDAVQLEGNLVLGLDLWEPLHAAVDLGVIAHTDGKLVAPTYGAGLSFDLGKGLRAGGELFGEHFVEGPGAGTGWLMAGPNAAWSEGRVWVTVGLLLGVTETAPDATPRLLWAIAF
jgi:hypothetical protein